LLAGIVSVSLQRELAYRVDLLVRLVLVVLTAAGALGALAAVYARVRTLAGWPFGEAVILFGMFVVVNGFLQALVEPNLEWFQTKVREGLLDDVLLKPVPSAFLASFGTCRPFALVDVLVGAGLVTAGVITTHARVGVGRVGESVLLLAWGAAIAWSGRLMLATTAFWAGGLELTVLFSAPWQLGRFPVDVYGARLRVLLTYVVPVAFVSTFPARTLTHGVNVRTLASGFVVASLAVLLALRVWRNGLRRYTSATS
jgi:ABC-2 type transport system permease protein